MGLTPILFMWAALRMYWVLEAYGATTRDARKGMLRMDRFYAFRATLYCYEMETQVAKIWVVECMHDLGFALSANIYFSTKPNHKNNPIYSKNPAANVFYEMIVLRI